MNRKFSAIKQAFKDALKRTKKSDKKERDPNKIYTKWIDLDGNEHYDEDDCTYVSAYDVSGGASRDYVKAHKAEKSTKTVNGQEYTSLTVPGTIVKVGPSVIIAGNLSSTEFEDFNDKLDELDIFEHAVNLKLAYRCFFNARIKTIPSGMFRNCNKLVACKSTFERSRISEVPSDVFSGCANLTSVSECFARCANLTFIKKDIFKSNSKLQDLSFCFSACGVDTLHPGLLDSIEGNKINLESMFSDCRNLDEILPGFFPESFSKKTLNLKDTFAGCRKLFRISRPFPMKYVSDDTILTGVLEDTAFAYDCIRGNGYLKSIDEPAYYCFPIRHNSDKSIRDILGNPRDFELNPKWCI